VDNTGYDSGERLLGKPLVHPHKECGFYSGDRDPLNNGEVFVKRLTMCRISQHYVLEVDRFNRILDYLFL